MGAMQNTDMIVLCGGNAEYIEGRGYMIQQHIGLTAIPPEIAETGMAVRYLDIDCLWLELSCSFKKEIIGGWKTVLIAEVPC